MIEEFIQQEIYSIGVLIVCLMLSAFFSSAETAITSIGTLKAKHMIDSGGRKLAHLRLWVTSPNRVIATILIYNNAVNILASSVVTYVTNKYFQNAVIGIATGFTTFLVLIFGEILPKSYAKAYSEKLAIFSMRFIVPIYWISYPIVEILSIFADFVIKIFSKGEKTSPLITEEEIEFMVSEGEKAGVIKDIKKDIIEGAFDFDETKVKEIMTPRTNLTAFSMKTSIDKAIELTLKTGFSRIPIYKENIDHIIGVILAKDMLEYLATPDRKGGNVSDFMREVFFAPESKSIMDVFKDLKRSKNHLAIIIDEYGGTAGIVTMEDILEEIVGEIQDEHDVEKAKISKIEANLYEVSGAISIDNFVDFFKIDLKKIPEEQKFEDVDTLAGWITQLIGQMPRVGQKITLGKYSVEVHTVDKHRIDVVRVKKIKRTLLDEIS